MKHFSKPAGLAKAALCIAAVLTVLASCKVNLYTARKDAQLQNNQIRLAVEADRYTGYKVQSSRYAKRMRRQGRRIFRYETFGNEVFWSDTLQLNKVIGGEKFGGTGPGLTPIEALRLGLKVDKKKVTPVVVAAVRAGVIPFNSAFITMVLLKVNAVVGVRAEFNSLLSFKLNRIGLTCGVCHSTTNNSVAPGFGRRLDGWPNQDLQVGQIIAMSPNLQAIARSQDQHVDSVRRYLLSWAPGHFDAQYNVDGKSFRPDGRPGTTIMPAAFGLAGVNLHTYNGWGGVTYWNAYVANNEMMGQGRFYDPRLNDPKKYPLAVRSGAWNRQAAEDHVTSKLAALHLYQLGLPAPKAPGRIYDEHAAARGQVLFNNKAKCASCHVPPLFTEPGHDMHKGSEIGIDDYQAQRSPDEMYRTTPLKGLFVKTKGGYYHDGRFKSLQAVVQHYNSFMKLQLSREERDDLVAYLKSL